MPLQFSFIIPVYNRPEEIVELLQSFKAMETDLDYEIVIVEDGSKKTSEATVNQFKGDLSISYFYKENTGPGDSRNYGMQKAQGNYFIILDSDVILPENYLSEVDKSLKRDYVDCFGGPDGAHKSFTALQKAINFAMTSFITTGGIRGNRNAVDKFQPRSFNMGLSKEAFLASGGFGRIHPGEDPDLSIRLWGLGFQTKLIPSAVVFHKRRISWKKFYEQVHKFGLVRPILNKWHPSTKKLTYWFPTLFGSGLILAILLLFFNFGFLFWLYMVYFLVAFIVALVSTKSIVVAIVGLLAILVQFFGYGYGFLKSTIAIHWLNKMPEERFPKLFFKSK
ncbi:glycosyltransferase [Hyunsoonleella sp. SJ7]|uniref:Glycosyltransferase n=1 Tax=Hyunsoonleella aquatilis TaxID=2762758 RepID=A0A923HAU3_9FLAO|nr:glycosyltransferase [Hyunsoonleella aquatilis]MBC3759738.1 glycosyltransferase [Hyunsoonleella aquatilis]